MSKPIYLALENGIVFEGQSFGAEGETTGEVVFTTGMTGYLETLTDPSYYGQIVVQTFPLIGNYGVIPSDFERGKPALKAYIIKEWCRQPSNFRSEGQLDTFLKENGVIGLCGIDTRRLTRILRERGVMNGKITASLDKIEEIRAEAADYRVVNAVDSVTVKERTVSGEGDKLVALLDFGAKDNITRELVKRGVRVLSLPAETTAEEIVALKPDGIMLSNGPGDPEENAGVIAELAKLARPGVDIPIFGICLGHQLLALARGGKTYKLKYGHRGANQPVKELATGLLTITSQNHGYAVSDRELPEGGEMSHVNANDMTCEGMVYRDIPAFSVQYHPEAAAGPHDSNFLFDRFIAMINKGGR